MSKRLDRYKEGKENRLAGKFNGAPLFHAFKRLSTIVPAIPKGMQVMTLAGNGVGKSQSVIGISIMPIYSLIKKHGYKAKFYIFLLEDPITLFEDRLFCHVMNVKFNISIDPQDLNSVKETLLDKSVEDKFEVVDRIVDDILSYCVIYDSISHPTGLYKTLRTHSDELGTHHYKKKVFEYKRSDGTLFHETKEIYDRYEPTDPEMHNIVIVDNLNNLDEEYNDKLKKTLDTKGCISLWTKEYARKQICKHWNWTVWNIMQTDLASDRKQYDWKGNVVVEKVEPNLSSLGEDKTASRAHHLIFAIFAPSRFDLEEYEDFDITRMGGNFRSLMILKSNYGLADKKLPMYFNGQCSVYKELPKGSSMTESNYKQYAEYG